MDAQYILDNSEILVKADCKIVDGVLYEKCNFVEGLFDKSNFYSTEDETYYLDGSDHIYRFFTDVDDYDYVTDPEMLAKLDAMF